MQIIFRYDFKIRRRMHVHQIKNNRRFKIELKTQVLFSDIEKEKKTDKR